MAKEKSKYEQHLNFQNQISRLVWRGRGERDHQSCLMPTVKHPETNHVWGCFSVKGVVSLTTLPKNTAMNLKNGTSQLLGDEECLFQHDGSPCHIAKVMTKLLGEQNVKILGPWPGNSPGLNPIENLWSRRRVDNQKLSNSVRIGSRS